MKDSCIEMGISERCIVTAIVTSITTPTGYWSRLTFLHSLPRAEVPLHLKLLNCHSRLGQQGGVSEEKAVEP